MIQIDAYTNYLLRKNLSEEDLREYKFLTMCYTFKDLVSFNEKEVDEKISLLIKKIVDK